VKGAGCEARLEQAPNSMLMIHDASGVCMGNASDMEDMAELLDLISDNIADAYAARAGGTRDQWRARMQAETWYLPEDAVSAGLADVALAAPAVSEPNDEPEPEPEPEPSMVRTFDPAAYGYRGPHQPAAREEQPPHLVVSLADLVGAEAAAALRSAVTTSLVGAAVPVHHTATADRPWDSGPNEKRLPSPMPVATAKAAYAWYDESQVEDGTLPKSACKLPHHEVSEDGTPGVANLAATRNALARLPQSDIPADQHDAVRRHLQAHLDDAKQTDDAAPLWEPGDLAAAPAAPEDAWASVVAHLTEHDEPDTWSQLVSHLTTTASSSAATEA